MSSVAIIGGGPAGFMAAIAAAQARQERAGGISAAAPAAPPTVTVFDSGIPLATILRTGGGRCNIANSLADKQQLAAQYPRGGKFLFSPFARFGPREVITWFVSRGCPLVEEEGGRMFPRTGRAEDVRDLLAGEAKRLGVKVHAQQAVTGILRTPGGFEVLTARGAQAFDRVVIATGGDAKAPPGSGYALAASLGHTITPLAPSLAALVTRETWPGTLAGLTLRQARISARFAGKKAAVETGDVLFTHGGISGPLAFRLSSRCAFLALSAETPLELQLSPLPDRTAQEIETALLAFIGRSPHQRAAEAVRQLVPRSLAEAIVDMVRVDPMLPCSRLGREERKSIVSLVERLPLTVIDREKGNEMVTAGGIVLTEVDPRTMGSRLVPGLFFCGEVLDIDGFTGGFNLLAAWSTGRCAGLAAAA
jgi:predicted Rossmann fold flavoprotein